MSFIERVEQERKEKHLPSDLAEILMNFYRSYQEALAGAHGRKDSIEKNLIFFLEAVLEEIRKPFHFEPFHKALRAPTDYYQFGLEMMRPLILFDQSRLLGLENLRQIEEFLAKGENVILLANHQTEPDPQLISLLLEQTSPQLAEEMIFVAGHRVVTDPLAIPFSKGRYLLCIYSKRHIEFPPEKRAEKIQHNQKTMKKMVELLNEGGKCIYVAPSGGRDRPDDEGKIHVAPFDPASLEMFWLMAQKSSNRTHFFPLALSTYNVLPPPNSILTELGEQRQTKRSAIHLAFCSEIQFDQIPLDPLGDKQAKRTQRAAYVTQVVAQAYQNLVSRS